MAEKARRAGKRIGLLDTLQLISHVCAICALAAVFVQMKSDSDARRVSLALDYISQNNSEPISGHRENLERALLPVNQELRELRAAGGVDRQNADRVIIEAFRLYEQSGATTPPRLSVVQLAEFYDQLLICREEKICDAAVLDANLGPQIIEFWTNYQTVIRDARAAGTTALGDRIKDYVTERAGNKGVADGRN